MVLQTIGKAIAIIVAVIAIVAGLLLLFGALLAIAAAIGGLVGAGIAAGYNVLLGTSFDVNFWAIVGSFLSVFIGGSAASSSE